MRQSMEWLDLFDRVVTNAKVKIGQLSNGRCLMTVSTLRGVVIDTFECASREEAERHLREAGYRRIPPYVAIEIDTLLP